MNDLRWSLFGDEPWHGVKRPEWREISNEEYDKILAESLESDVKFETAGVIRKGWLSDIWTVDDGDGEGEPEILVDCE